MAANSQFSIAVHVLTMLARSNDENTKSEHIARSVNTNPVVIRRLLGQLSAAKLVISQTGACGGTRLAKRPSDIMLYDVYRAVACGEVFALPPNEASQDCPVGRSMEAILCRLQKEIDKGIGDRLSKYTVADVIEWVEAGKVSEQGVV